LRVLWAFSAFAKSTAAAKSAPRGAGRFAPYETIASEVDIARFLYFRE
jgi:hypothetical protein